MEFPDLNQFRQLQKDLWQWPSSRAALMVGAGFSLNAVSAPGVSTRFPVWRDLSRAMFNEIYPAHPNETDEQRIQRKEQFDPSDALRLASAYEAIFGRQKLDSFLCRAIPDSSYQPGALHTLLLQLPWKDVFTTNYDTLLERTEIPERAYQPVTTVNDLTTARAPRIIKLHGSFPSQTPFIITEEDYRTYPQRFAPFVNTVRQSLIENAFVLIGFSGEDPNFLQWTGWIRDELGDHHAPIYLVGPLSLSNTQRLLLTQRGVTPIDLASVFLDKDPPARIHASAIEWFLRSLHAAKRQRPERWLKSKTTAQETADFEHPILASGLVEPEEVRFDSSQNLDEATVLQLIKRWRYERDQYPGWLVATDEKRSLLWNNTRDRIGPLLTFVANENWSPADRILLFHELHWRLDVAMVPLFSNWLEPFEVAVDELLKAGISAKPSVLTDIPATEVAEAWLDIAFALLREAREIHNAERWDTLKEKIDQVVTHYPQFTDRYQYEQALWRLWNLERSQAKAVLTQWSPSRNSPLAMMWKAGLLVELEEARKARSLLRTALRDIRKSFHNTHERNIDLLSLEGWCTYLLSAVERAAVMEDIAQGNQQETDWAKLYELPEEFLERWQELKAWDCDPWPLMEYFAMVLSEDPPALRRETQVVRDFDPGHRKVTGPLFGGDHIEPRLPAFAYIRLYEQAGIPIRFAGEALRKACKWIAPFTDFWGPALLVRAGKVDDLKNFMERTQVATMEPALAQRLNSWVLDALQREFSSLRGPIGWGSAQQTLLEALVEVLSRLTLKLESADLQEGFSLAIALHRRPEIYSHTNLHNVCTPWFRRLFEAANEQQLFAWLSALIRFPPYHDSDLPEYLRDLRNDWPDPMTDFPAGRLRVVQESLSERTDTDEAIAWLLARAQNESGKGRHRAVRRLICIFSTDLMTAEQKESLGRLLWEQPGTNGLPDLPDFGYYGYYGYLHLPAPAEIDVVSKVKEHLLTLTPPKSVDGTNTSIQLDEEDRIICEWAFASKPVVQLPYEWEGKIEWSWDESWELWAQVVEWWQNDKIAFDRQIPSSALNSMTLNFIEASVERAGMFLARAVLPNMDSASEDEWSEVLAFLSETREHEIYLTPAFPYVLLHRPSKSEALTQTIFEDLSSDDAKAVKASAEAVRHWIYLADADLVDKPPTNIIDKLIHRVVFRRSEGIQTCLDQLAHLLIEKPDFFDLDQVHFIVASLSPWSQATRLPLSEERDGTLPEENFPGDFPEEERPELRVLLGKLASALRIWLKRKCPDQPEPAEISHLRESYELDSLPEVRRSFPYVETFAMTLSTP